MSKGIFITATGTDIGKTYVTALLIKKLRQNGYHAGYYKAALSGAERVNGELVPGDAVYVNTTAGIGAQVSEMVSYVYEHAVSPHLAAKLEGNPVEIETVLRDYWRAYLKYDYITVEGSGGIVCPIRMDQQQIMLTDLIKALKLKTLLVASAALGTINSVVLTAEYAKAHGIEVRGIILNHFHSGDVMEEDNKAMIERLTEIPVIACVRDGAEELDIDAARLAALYE